MILRALPLLIVALAPDIASGQALSGNRDRSVQIAQSEACRGFVGSVCAIVGGRRQTFANACVAQRMGGTVIRRGPCLGRVRPLPRGPSLADPRARPDRPNRRRLPGATKRRRGIVSDCAILRPVCARLNGKRQQFDTPCDARAAGAKILRLGLCRQPSSRQARKKASQALCATARNPVCAAKNGKRRTYRNACHATVDLAVVIRKGRCEK